MHTVVLKGRGDFSEWRDAARILLLCQTEPERIHWRVAAGGVQLAGFAESDLPVPSTDMPPVWVPAAFLELADNVMCHSDD